MQVKFDYPLSDTAQWKGQLHVRATVDQEDVELDQVIHEDPSGKKSNITYLVEQWAGHLYDHICEMARNDAYNLRQRERRGRFYYAQNEND